MGERCFPQGEGRQLWVRDSALRLKDQLSCPLALQSNGLKIKQSFFVVFFFFKKRGHGSETRERRKGAKQEKRERRPRGSGGSDPACLCVRGQGCQPLQQLKGAILDKISN